MSIFTFNYKQLFYSFAIVLICCNVIDGFEYFTEKPSFMDPCKIYEPEFTKCSTKSVQKFIDHLIAGVPELKDKLGSLDPIKIDHLYFKQDNNEAATLRANLTDIRVTGFNGLKIKESKVSKKDFSWDTKCFIPLLRIDAKYQMEGRILLIPLQGNGNLFIEIENLDILMHTKTRLIEKGNLTFYDVKKIDATLKMTNVRTKLDNLFNGRSKEIEDGTNELFNQNWRDFYGAVSPLVVETVEHVLHNILKIAFDAIAANYFVEDIPTPQQLYGKKD